MVEYGLLASRSMDLFEGFLWQVKDAFYAIPFSTPIAIGLGIALLAYLFMGRNK